MNKLSQFFGLVIVGTLAVCLVATGLAYLVRKAKHRSLRAGGFFWVVQFLGMSDVPPPTPQEQAEQENREKKNRGAGDSP